MEKTLQYGIPQFDNNNVIKSLTDTNHQILFYVYQQLLRPTLEPSPTSKTPRIYRLASRHRHEPDCSVLKRLAHWQGPERMTSLMLWCLVILPALLEQESP